MIEKLIQRQRKFFESNKTKNLDFRLHALRRLEGIIRKNEKEICLALEEDLGKSSCESYMTEIGMLLSELAYIRKRLPLWVREGRVLTPLAQFYGKSFVVKEPYGLVLVIAPWNYPFLLSLGPVIGAIAAGNCCVLKPSEYAPASSALLARLLGEIYPPFYLAVVEGDREESQMLLEQNFDYIFFTGGKEIGKLVMKKAAGHLTPVTLELGGKSPCIVDKTADLDLAARRIIFGKLLNCGQTCIAPDYVLVEECVRWDFLQYLRKWIRRCLGEEPLQSPDYPRIINHKHYQRLLGLLEGQTIWEGGYGDEKKLQIAPTILYPVSWEDRVMEEEIFGPILPLISWRDLSAVIRKIKEREKPLALYLFTNDKGTEKRILGEISFGGGCINDTIVHMASPYMGFGGVGASGMGSYHGRKSFTTFSHEKAIMKKGNIIDIPLRYYPFNSLKEKLIKGLL